MVVLGAGNTFFRIDERMAEVFVWLVDLAGPNCTRKLRTSAGYSTTSAAGWLCCLLCE